MNVIIRLLGTAAVATTAYFAYDKVTRERNLEDQYKQMGDAAVRLSSKHLVTVLVLGFQRQGRSSFINTIFRVLYKEEGPLIMRAETGHTKITTTSQRVLKVKNKLLKYPKYLMSIIDTPCSSTLEDLDENAVRNVLRGGGIGNNVLKTDPSQKRNVQRVPECVILVIKAEECYMGGPALDPLSKLVRIIREEGLQFVVVLSHKKEAQMKSIDLRDLTTNVALKAGTDLVHCIENYVADHLVPRKSSNVRNNFETHKQTLTVVRQCLEYARQHRLIKLNGLPAFYDSSASD
jgi:hypothetical protein